MSSVTSVAKKKLCGKKMKILDKYVAKNFLVGYAIAFCVLIGMRITIDLFANIDEFTEHADSASSPLSRISSLITPFRALCISATSRE